MELNWTKLFKKETMYTGKRFIERKYLVGGGGKRLRNRQK